MHQERNANSYKIRSADDTEMTSTQGSVYWSLRLSTCSIIKIFHSLTTGISASINVKRDKKQCTHLSAILSKSAILRSYSPGTARSHA